MSRNRSTKNTRASSTNCFSFLLPEEEGQPVVKDKNTQEKLKWVIVAVTWLSWILAIVSVSRCTFYKYGPSSQTNLRGFGLFNEAAYEDPADPERILGCIAYADRSYRAGPFKAARGFAVFMTAGISMVLLLVNTMVICAHAHLLRRQLLLCIRILLPVVFVLNVFVFLAFSRDECHEDGYKCEVGGAGICAIVNVFLLLLLCVLVFLVPAPSHPLMIPYSTTQARDTAGVYHERGDQKPSKKKTSRQKNSNDSGDELV